MRQIIKLIASLFYIGYFPFFPGTIASLIGIVLYLMMPNSSLHLLVLAIILVLGFSVSGRAEKIFARRDSPRIVIDELAGMLISLLFLPRKPVIIILAFLVFRIFDIFKPPPIRRLEGASRGFGVMLDDIAAGVYTNILLQVFLRFTT